jgi:hypothetical protein
MLGLHKGGSVGPPQGSTQIMILDDEGVPLRIGGHRCIYVFTDVNIYIYIYIHT